MCVNCFAFIVALIGYNRIIVNAVHTRQDFYTANVGFATDDKNILVGLEMGERFSYNPSRKINKFMEPENNIYNGVTRRFNTIFPQNKYKSNNQNKPRESLAAQNNEYYKRNNTGIEVKDLLNAVYSKDQYQNHQYDENPSININRAYQVYEENRATKYNFYTQSPFSPENQPSENEPSEGNSKVKFINDGINNINRNYGLSYIPSQAEGQRFEQAYVNFKRIENSHGEDNNNIMRQRKMILPKFEATQGEDKIIKVKLRDSINIQNLQKNIVGNHKLRKSKDLKYPHGRYHMNIRIVAEPEGDDEGVMQFSRNNLEFIDDMNNSEFEDLLDLARIRKEDEKLKVPDPIRRSNTNFLSIEDDFLE